MPNKPKSTREIADFRAKVCAAATELFTERGVRNVTMRQIADKVGVSAMTPYRYFQDKDEILAAVRADAFTRFAIALERAAASTTNAREKAAAVGKAYVRFAMKNPARYHLMFDFSQSDSARYPEFAKADERAKLTMTSYVQSLIDEGLLKGDAQLIGVMYFAMIHGVISLDLAGALKNAGPQADELRQAMAAALSTGINITQPRMSKPSSRTVAVGKPASSKPSSNKAKSASTPKKKSRK